VRLIATPDQSDVGGDLNIVPITAEQSNEIGIDAIIVDV
jgi:hypothetical protein